MQLSLPTFPGGVFVFAQQPKDLAKDPGALLPDGVIDDNIIRRPGPRPPRALKTDITIVKVRQRL
jgi:hypothetical protein